MKCNHCKRDLPESAFSPRHRTCKKCEAEKEAKYRTQRILEDESEDKFNSFYGGYIIAILNHTRPKEYKYTIKGTNGYMIQTNDLDYFRKKLSEVV